MQVKNLKNVTVRMSGVVIPPFGIVSIATAKWIEMYESDPIVRNCVKARMIEILEEKGKK